MSLGLPCTSFIWINSPTHARSDDNPLGDQSLGYVQDGNKYLAGMYRLGYRQFAVVLCYKPRLTSRAVLLIMLGVARCVYWLLEQPNSSKLPKHPDWQYLAAVMKGLHLDYSKTFLLGSQFLED